MPLRSLPKLSHRLINRFVGYLLISIISIVFFGLLYYGNLFFSIKKIEIIGSETGTSITGIERLKGGSILFLSPEDTEKKILMQNPNLKNISIYKKYPDELNIVLESTNPVAILQLNTGFAYLDSDGKITAKKKEIEHTLPLIHFYQTFDYSQLQSGDTLNYIEITTVLYLLQTVKNLGLTIISIDIKGTSMIVFNLTKGEQILFSSEKSKSKQVFEVETIIRQFKIEAREFKTLDLRFDKPIVKF